MKKTVIFIVSLMSSTLIAQTLTLHNCINRALSTHPDIKKSILQIQKNKSAISIARADYMPQLTLSAEYDPTKTYALPVNGVFHTKDSDGWIAGASLEQKIWDFSKTSSNIKAQKVQADISKLSLKDAKALLVYKVKLQYELILLQQKAIKVREKDLNSKEELYKQAKELFKEGLKTQADVSRFLSSVYEAKDALFIAYANFNKARVTLSLYINEPINKNVILKNTDAKKYWHIESESTVLQNAPSLKALKKDIKKSEFTYKSAKASHYGSVDAIASYTRQNTLNQYDSTLVGIRLNIPLYSGGRTSALVEQSILNKQNTQEEYNSKILSFKEEFETLNIDLQRYTHTISSKKSQLQSAQQTKKVLDARYKEGLSTYIEVLDAIAQELNAKLGLLQAKYERNSIIYRLEYLQGQII